MGTLKKECKNTYTKFTYLWKMFSCKNRTRVSPYDKQFSIATQMHSSCSAIEQLDKIVVFVCLIFWRSAFDGISGPGCPWSLGRQLLFLDDTFSSNLGFPVLINQKLVSFLWKKNPSNYEIVRSSFPPFIVGNYVLHIILYNNI